MALTNAVSDVAIAGGGLIGLAIAFELAGAGASVRVYDIADPGRAASWAGAGMLAPFTEIIEDSAMQQLCELSLAQYPSFAGRVAERGGVDPHLQLSGILSAAYDSEEFAALSAHHRTLSDRGLPCQLLDRRETLTLEPALGAKTVGALLVEQEGQIDNRRLGRALRAACESSGVIVEANVRQLKVECNERRALGVVTEQGFFAAENVINAAGAWSAQLSGVPPAAAAPVFPVKGQMLTIEIPARFMRHVTWVPGAYFVPRIDGRLLVGATVEHEGYDVRVTAGGIGTLLGHALRAAPSLSGFAISEMWAGLRPGSPDGRPFIGKTALDNYLLATGHFRNGILLAPITATLIADAVSGRSNDLLAPFSPLRSLPDRAAV